jgi:hypothetical protein
MSCLDGERRNQDEEENLYRQHPSQSSLGNQPAARINRPRIVDLALSSSLMWKENVPLVPSTATIFTYRSASGMIIE